MSSGAYTKLFQSITESTVWGEPYATRIVWITLLAMADARGNVFGSIPGIARRANVGIPEAEEALAAFQGPDRYSRTPDSEGRRIEAIDGGWRLINHAKYRAMRSAEERREYFREQKAKQRAEGKDDESFVHECPQCPPDSTEVTPPAPSPAPYTSKDCSLREHAETRDASSGQPPHFREAGEHSSQSSIVTSAGNCPTSEIIDLYHRLLPTLPQVKKRTRARAAHIRARWREDLPTLEDWESFFRKVASSPFLTGKVPGSNDRPPFLASLDWLCKPGNYARVIEGEFHRKPSRKLSLAERADQRMRERFRGKTDAEIFGVDDSVVAVIPYEESQ